MLSSCALARSPRAIPHFFRHSRAKLATKGGSVCRYNPADTQLSKDWRATAQLEVIEDFYAMWSSDQKKHTEIISDSCVYDDRVWGQHLVVGRHAVLEHIKKRRKAYPDLTCEVLDVSIAGPHSMIVRWRADGTNLGPDGRHRATHHFSSIEGLDILEFSPKGDELTHCTRFREATSEERLLLTEQVAADADPLHLHKLI